MLGLYKTILVLGMLALGSSCAHYEDRLKSDLDPWVGQHPDRLVEKWGAPNSSYAMESGVKVLSYFNDRQVTRSTGIGYSAWRWGNYSYSETCKINFFTDSSQKTIERYSTVGDISSCVDVLNDIKRSSN